MTKAVMWFDVRWSTGSRMLDKHLAESYWMFEAVREVGRLPQRKAIGPYILTR